MSERVITSNLKHLPKSILQLNDQMHTHSLCRKLGKAGIYVNLVIYDSNKEVLGCRDDPGFEAQFSNTYIIQVNQIYLEIGGNSNQGPQIILHRNP
jgi:hypothetical protein